MVWKKQGLVYVPDGQQSWARSGAQLPTVDVIGDQVIRVYFGSKDPEGFGRTGFVDLDVDDPHKILDVGTEPVLDLGQLGAFDDCGAVPNSIINVAGQKFLYYQGFQRSGRVPYLTFTGLAIGDGRSFRKSSRTPIMDRTEDEPFIRSTSLVHHDNGSFKMWYVSTPAWIEDEHGIHYLCVVRYATSADGISWETHGHVCLEPRRPDEYAVGRPAVIRDAGVYRMWFSIRSFSKLYAIGYAESEDGIVWERLDDEVGIETSASGWDSEMICYPYVVDVKGQRLMFYNGNARGISGFGYALLEK